MSLFFFFFCIFVFLNGSLMICLDLGNKRGNTVEFTGNCFSFSFVLFTMNFDKKGQKNWVNRMFFFSPLNDFLVFFFSYPSNDFFFCFCSFFFFFLNHRKRRYGVFNTRNNIGCSQWLPILIFYIHVEFHNEQLINRIYNYVRGGGMMSTCSTNTK